MESCGAEEGINTDISVWTQVAMEAEVSDTEGKNSEAEMRHSPIKSDDFTPTLLGLYCRKNDAAFCPSCNPLLWSPLSLNRQASCCTAPQKSSSILFLLPDGLKRRSQISAGSCTGRLPEI